MKELITIAKDPDTSIEKNVERVLADDTVLSDILNGILSKNDKIRSKNYEILEHISKTHPKRLYLKWDFLRGLLTSSNHFHRYMAINLLANLVSVDSGNKFEEIFDRYFGNIGSDRTMVAGQATLNSGKIAKALPKLQHKITSILLNIDSIHKGKQTELLKGYAIASFDKYYDESKEKKQIIDFVTNQLKSNSPKTKRIAKEFLKKWDQMV